MELHVGNGSTKGMITTNKLNSQALIEHETQSTIGPMALKCAVDLRISDHIHAKHVGNGSTKGMITTNKLSSQALIEHETQSTIGPMALKCAVDLRIPDHIHAYGKPIPLYSLARAIPVPSSKDAMLRCLMRVLVKKGYFEEPEEAMYCLTPISHNLLGEGSTSMTGFVKLMSETMVRPMLFFSEWFKAEGSSPFEMAHGGKTLWDIVGNSDH